MYLESYITEMHSEICTKANNEMTVEKNVNLLNELVISFNILGPQSKPIEPSRDYYYLK